MEEQIALLTANLEAVTQSAQLTNTMFAETYYFLSIPLMMIIHAGFLAYEMGATRLKNTLSSGIKNLLAFAFVIITFYFFGWWVYWAFPTGFDLSQGAVLTWSGSEFANSIALPWGESVAAMGPNVADHASGVFWGAFALFAATTASIMSGALIERVQTVGFVILAIVLGSFAWVLAAAWGWHADGWLVTVYGVHDFGAAGLVHAVAGFFALGVLINLGPRVGKFNADGSANHIAGHNMPLTVVGLMLIIVGFFGFLMACIILPGESWSWTGFAGDGTAWGTTIYGTYMSLSSLAFGIVLAVSGGIIGAWVFTRDPFWMMSGALAGIISVASGLDVYFPSQIIIISALAGILLKPCADFLERFGIDDAVGAVTVHGTMGIFGMLVFGVLGSGLPTVDGGAVVSLWGQFVGSLVFIAIGIIPGYIVSAILKAMGMLRVPDAVQEKGLDVVKVPAQAYPEGMTSPASEDV